MKYLGTDTLIPGTDQYSTTCFKSSCYISPNKCIKRDTSTFEISFSECPDGYVCQVISDYSGVCIWYTSPKQLD